MVKMKLWYTRFLRYKMISDYKAVVGHEVQKDETIWTTLEKPQQQCSSLMMRSDMRLCKMGSWQCKFLLFCAFSELIL